MPKAKESNPQPVPISRGAGMTAGLELALVGSTFVLVDHSPDHRFAADVEVWSSASSKTPNKRTKK